MDRPEGHNEECVFCGKVCNVVAGNPSMWPIVFPHDDGTGRGKVHCSSCVIDRVCHPEKYAYCTNGPSGPEATDGMPGPKRICRNGKMVEDMAADELEQMDLR